jgi:hypothetical protein
VGNLTGGGLYKNIEQYEEITLTATAARRVQDARITALWQLGEPFVASSLAWQHYRAKQAEIARRRAELQRASLATDHRRRPPHPNALVAARAESSRAAARTGGAPRADRRETGRQAHHSGTARAANDPRSESARGDDRTRQRDHAGSLARAPKARLPTVALVNYGKVRDLDALIVGSAPSTSTGPTNKRRNARADNANWISFADAVKLPRLQRAVR